MADKSVRVEVRGLKELSAAFQQLDDDTAQRLKASMLDISQGVVSVATALVVADVGSGKASSSIKAKASTRGASIAFGGTRAPYFPWLDFGGSVGRGHKVGVAWSGAIIRDWKGRPAGDGRYVYVAIKEQGPTIRAKVGEAIEAAIASAGFEFRST